MTIEDQVLLEITIWRENRGGGEAGMHSVANVILNRAARRDTAVYDECVRRLQFSSVTAAGDPELTLWPGAVANRTWTAQDEAAWQTARRIAQQAAEGTLADITSGSIDYYAPAGMAAAAVDPEPYTMPDGVQVRFPKAWNRNVLTFEAEIAGQLFFREA